MTAFPVETAAEALFIAIEMERRAISLYERAQLLHPAPEVGKVIQLLLRDERRHLAQFEALAKQDGGVPDQALLLSAQAAGVLHPGGLMAAEREEAFADARELIAYAAREESTAVGRYQSFAAACQGEAKDMFLLIAHEEEKHLKALNALLEESGA